MSKPTTVQITLTPQQQAQVKQATGKAVTTLKLEPLEARLTPGGSLN